MHATKPPTPLPDDDHVGMPRQTRIGVEVIDHCDLHAPAYLRRLDPYRGLEIYLHVAHGGKLAVLKCTAAADGLYQVRPADSALGSLEDSITRANVLRRLTEIATDAARRQFEQRPDVPDPEHVVIRYAPGARVVFGESELENVKVMPGSAGHRGRVVLEESLALCSSAEDRAELLGRQVDPNDPLAAIAVMHAINLLVLGPAQDPHPEPVKKPRRPRSR